MKKYICIVGALLLFLISCGGEKYTQYRVYPYPDTLSVTPGEKTFIAIKVEIPSGSHIYGNPKGPGTGKPTEVSVLKTPGFDAMPAQFLVPEKFYYPGEKEHTWGYENETMVFVPIRVHENVKKGTYSVPIDFNSLLCSKSTCIPRLFHFDYPVSVGEKGSGVISHPEEILSRYRQSRPPMDAASGNKQEDDSSVKSFVKDEGVPLLEGLSFEPQFIEVGITGIMQAIIFGIIAGLILNFMPCVLPVVSLKIMSFVQHADKNRRDLVIMGLLFTAGIMTTFFVLAILAAFFGYNWGGLFQHRFFLIIMTGIVFALALSMFGVFTINIPTFLGKVSSETGNVYADAYLKGLLATFLATPCSGPFLGGTLAWALSQKPVVVFVIFMSVGAGMSLPYLILTINPKFLRFLPKPGEWMKTFERVMAFILVFTSIYLIGIMDEKSVMPMITLLGFLSVGFWQYGRYGSLIQGRMSRIISILVLMLIIAAGYFVSFQYLYRGEAATVVRGDEFTMQRILENRKAGRISMVKFTADWCPNCRLVEKLSLHKKRVAAAIDEGGIDFLTADITRKNLAAEKLLVLLKSHSIPALAVFPSGESFRRPIVLRDIYSEEDVLKAISMAQKNKIDKTGKSIYRINIPDLKVQQ